MKSRIYDCFCYFNEDHILELRFETLWDYVDYFVISEASYTHAGNDRKLNFDPIRFKKYASKIRYLPLNNKPAGPNNFWKNENFIRNNLANGLYDAKKDDLILISDLDEIPNPKKISLYNTDYIRGDFEQKYYSYYLNNYWIGDVDDTGALISKSNIWRGTKVTTFKYFMNFFNANPTSVRSYKSSGIFRSIKRAWFRKFKVQSIKEGGWHFTWVFSIEDLVKKMESTAHQEFNVIENKDPATLTQIINSGRDFNKPFARYVLQELDETFPEYLLNNQTRFKSYLGVKAKLLA